MGIKLIKMKTYKLQSKDGDRSYVFTVDSKNDKVEIRFVNKYNPNDNYGFTETLERSRIRWKEKIAKGFTII